MTRSCIFLLLIASANAADRGTIMTDPAQSRAFKQKYVALTDSWVASIEFTRAEQAAMQAGKKWEGLMTAGPDDPLAKKILAAGEPSYDALSSYYPGKILDRTVLGTYTDPHQPADGYHDESNFCSLGLTIYVVRFEEFTHSHAGRCWRRPRSFPC